MRSHFTLRRAASAALAAAAGTAAALVAGTGAGDPTAATAAAGASGAPGAASAAFVVPVAVLSGGRTGAPALDRGSYLLQAGSTLRVRVRARATWGHARTCRVALSNGRTRQSFSVRGVQSDFTIAMATSRSAKQGSWTLAVSCQAPRQKASRQATATVLVASYARARGTLLGRSRPDIEAAQALAPVLAGKVGLGGYPPNPGFPNGQCTYYAYIQRPDIYWTSVNNGAPRYGWDADKWSVYAAQYGHFPEGGTPEPGSVMVEPASSRSYVGHVAYVTQVLGNGEWVTQEMNTDGAGVPGRVFTVVNDGPGGPAYFHSGGQLHRHVVPGTVFIYGGQSTVPTQPPPPPPVTQTTTVTSTTTATTTSSSNSQPPPPPPPNWNETPGGVTHTWTNYTNAGGTQGPSIQTGQTVAVACKVPGFKVADGDTWWYRIASPPWSNQYYASADAFYNNGATSGSLIGTPFVDNNVANC